MKNKNTSILQTNVNNHEILSVEWLITICKCLFRNLLDFRNVNYFMQGPTETHIGDISSM